ncbi:EAL domain-containing protein [Neisseriaceae bacterium JH1-16]|nr:EAL domain-containing protein [Neisseriaceae bacterium JH1-16]
MRRSDDLVSQTSSTTPPKGGRAGFGRRLSLRQLFLMAVALGLLIPAILSSAIGFTMQRQELTSRFVADQRRLLEVVALGMQEPLWNLSRPSGAPLLASLMEDSRVISVQVTDNLSNTIFMSAVRSERRLGEVEVLKKPVVYRGEEIGEVSIEFDRQHIITEQTHLLLNFALLLLIQLVCATLLIMLILHQRFLKPMQRLAEQIAALAGLRLDGRFDWPDHDEVSQLGRKLEATRAELKRLVDESEAKTLALETDISRRREVEDALRRSETKYRELFWSNLDGIVISTLDGQILDANPAFLNLLDYSAEQLKLQNFWTLLTPESESAERLNIDTKVLRFGFCDDIDSLYITRFGNTVPVSVKTVAMRDAYGRIYAVWRMVRDVSEQRAAQEHIELTAKVFDNTVEAIMITDAELQIQSVNKAFTEITGYRPEEVVGAKPNILQSQLHDAAFYRGMWQQIRLTGAWQGELWDRKKNGAVYPQWIAINAVKNAGGEITHYIGIASDLSERKAADERIRFLAHFDVLTNLPNRLHLHERAELALQAARRDGSKLAVLLLDLDRFKLINESLGHSAGDMLLQIVAERLRGRLGPGEMLARQGGDEFIVLLPALPAGPTEVVRAAERILDCFTQSVELHGHVLSVSPSIGISVFPDDGDDVETLVRNADAAMYAAKSAGRNNYKFYTADLNVRASEVLAIESQFRGALERNEFVLHYQPQVDMADGRLLGAEALIRWNHPEQGLIGPLRFIPVAEERGFIVAIGNWVIREACRQLAEWQAAGCLLPKLALNLSALQFRDPGLLAMIEQQLAGNGLSGESLEIELTESVLMEDVEGTLQAVEALRGLGVSLAIDDFGTGYSSLSYLKRFKADTLKIDRSFVRDIPHDSDDSAITRAIIAMAKTLNMQVLAEGVETAQQWRFLAHEGCDQVQGYLVSPPLPAERFEAVLRRGVLLPGETVAQ